MLSTDRGEHPKARALAQKYFPHEPAYLLPRWLGNKVDNMVSIFHNFERQSASSIIGKTEIINKRDKKAKQDRVPCITCPNHQHSSYLVYLMIIRDQQKDFD